MFCPTCGIESPDGLQYCRNCGANLKVVGKALSLSDAIARSDRGPLPKIKELVKNIKIDHVTEEVSRAFDRINKEVLEHSTKERAGQPWWRKQKKTARERREEQLTKGTVSFFSGIGLTIFLYFISGALELRIPPDIVQKIPFAIEPMLRMAWLFGLLPMTAGIGHIVAGLLIRQEDPAISQRVIDSRSNDLPVRELRPRSTSEVEWPARDGGVASVTERTTNLLGVQESVASAEKFREE